MKSRRKKLRPHQKRRLKQLEEGLLADISPEKPAGRDLSGESGLPRHGNVRDFLIGNLLDDRVQTATDIPIRLGDPAVKHSAPSPRIEAARLLAVRQLAELFRTKCAALGSKKYYAHFEAWLWTARGQGEHGSGGHVVPVLPMSVTHAWEELKLKLMRHGVSENEAVAACEAIAARCASLCASLEAAETRPVDSPVHARWMEPGMIRLSCRKIHLDVSEAHLRKLQAMHSKHTERASASAGGTACEGSDAGGANSGAGGGTSEGAYGSVEFLEAVFCVLARLMALQGGHVAAGGMQAACPHRVFDVLRRDFGATFELFASPLNSRFSRYCSAAADVDAAFGSQGSFFTLLPLSGTFVTNPPFEPATIGAMADRIEQLLDRADTCQEELTFIVVLPRWPTLPCWQQLDRSAWSTHTLTLPRSQHAYIDGGQQYCRRHVARRLSNHDSSVIFLQSERAAARTPVTMPKQARLLDAFGMTTATDPGVGVQPDVRPKTMPSSGKKRKLAVAFVKDRKKQQIVET